MFFKQSQSNYVYPSHRSKSLASSPLPKTCAPNFFHSLSFLNINNNSNQPLLSTTTTTISMGPLHPHYYHHNLSPPQKYMGACWSCRVTHGRRLGSHNLISLLSVLVLCSRSVSPSLSPNMLPCSFFVEMHQYQRYGRKTCG